MVSIYAGSYITIDNDSLLSNGNGGGIVLASSGAQERSNNITISNSYI